MRDENFEFCVVCKDRACSNFYYGAATCHGCKCFFWRSVTSGAKYKCRFHGRCSMSTAGRKPCRACRFKRCLSSGMKPEAVGTRTLATTLKIMRKKSEDRSTYLPIMEETKNSFPEPEQKRARTDHRLLTQSLLLIDRSASNGNKHWVQEIREVFVHPELLDAVRIKMSYSPKTAATTTQMETCERRLLVWAIDWTRQLVDFAESFTTEDQIAILRSAFASLSILEIASQTVRNATNSTILCLPCDSFLSSAQDLNFTFFLNNAVMQAILSSLTRNLADLGLDEKELVLLKALVVLNPAARGLSADSTAAVGDLRNLATSALYQQCCDHGLASGESDRFARILLLIPFLITLAGDAVEHIRMRHAFVLTESEFDELLYQLLGDIFDECPPAAEGDCYVDNHFRHFVKVCPYITGTVMPPFRPQSLASRTQLRLTEDEFPAPSPPCSPTPKFKSFSYQQFRKELNDAVIFQPSGHPKQSIIDDEIWPPVFLPANVRSAKAMRPLDSDVFICTYPKCGTTWIQQIVHQLLKADVELQPGNEMCHVSPMIERMGVKVADAVDHPRILKTHFNFANLPKNKKAKCIYAVRNPKDVLISYFHHHRNFKIYDWVDGDFDVFFELFAKGRLGFGDYFEHLISWLPHIHDDNVLFLKYEDMVEDLTTAATRIGEFLGGEARVAVDDPLRLGEIVEAASIDEMKKDQRRWFPLSVLHRPEFIRKGGSRNWKSYFSKKQSDLIDALYRSHCAGAEAEFWWENEMAWDQDAEVSKQDSKVAHQSHGTVCHLPLPHATFKSSLSLHG